MPIVEFERLPSLSLDASKTGESTKCPWVGMVQGHAGRLQQLQSFLCSRGVKYVKHFLLFNF